MKRDSLQAARSQLPAITSDNLSIEAVPAWMIELAEQIKLIPPGLELPRGVIVGSAVIERCECKGQAAWGKGQGEKHLGSPLAPDPLPLYAWHLTDVQRAKTFRKPKRHPQPVWFNPF